MVEKALRENLKKVGYQNILMEGELQNAATHMDFLSVRREGARPMQRRIDYHNLDKIARCSIPLNSGSSAPQIIPR